MRLGTTVEIAGGLAADTDRPAVVKQCTPLLGIDVLARQEYLFSIVIKHQS